MAPTETPEVPKAKTADDLKKRAVHKDVTLPSGIKVDIRLPNLPQMIKSGTLPNELIDAAIEHQNSEKITKEILVETWEFTEFIVPLTLVTPEITKEDVKDLDINDLELLTAFAARRTDMDAIGHQLGGLETQEAFRKHRGIVDLDEALAG